MSHPSRSPGAPSRRSLILLVAVLLLGVLFGYLLAPGGTKGEPDVGVRRFIVPGAETNVGEWIVYRHSDGSRERWKVVASSPVEPHYRVEVVSEKEGRDPTPLPPRNLHRSMIGPNSFQLTRSLVYEPIEAAGRTWKTWRVELFDPKVGTEFTYWVTDELPAQGWARRRYVANDEEFITEVEEWGFSDR